MNGVFHFADFHTPATVGRVVLRDSCADARPRVGHLRLEIDQDKHRDWLDLAALCVPDTGPLALLNTRFINHGFGANRRAVAGSLMLRYGWAAGLQISAYFAQRRVMQASDWALRFSPMTLVEAIWVKDAKFIGLDGDPLAGSDDWAGAVSEAQLRAAFLQSLLDFTEPLIASQHAWSGFSRHALWSMVVSSWAAQVANVGETLGDSMAAIAEARAVFALDSEIAKAVPELYEITDGVSRKVCQNRAACCIYFKGPRRQFCASCPILPKDERLALNIAFVRSMTEERQRAAG